MIVSHRHKFIFFAVPKTATHAVREALRQHLSPDDWEQQMLFGKQTLPIPELAAVGHGHLTVQQVQSHLSAETWANYQKFAIVRNPYDRFVSACFFLNRNDQDFAGSATEFMKSRLRHPRFQQRTLIRPQSDMLVSHDDSIGVDYVGRYENLQDSYNDICDRTGIAMTLLNTKNTSEHASYRDYYDDDLRRLVGEFYADDLEQFSYEY